MFLIYDMIVLSFCEQRGNQMKAGFTSIGHHPNDDNLI
jgi:hypothetical protein